MTTAGTQPAERSARILIASSSETFRRNWIGGSPYRALEVEEAAGGADALAKLDTANWSEVLLDRRLHDLDVNEVLHTIRRRHPRLLVRLIDSDTGNAEPAVAEEPANHNIAEASPAAEAWSEEAEPVQEKFSEPARVEPLPGMMGNSPGLEQVYRMARLVSPRQTTVLITGETGTGKELLARAIHQISPRAKSPFVVVNCAAIPEQLLEAELFGHVRGAFTGAVQSRLGRIHGAQGGTLFLDEVGELPLGMQAKLLRFLQDGEVQRLGSSDVFRVDVRIVSATNSNLQRAVQEKTFRQDLYYRLAVFPLELPPLRLRRKDILPLAEHFLARLATEEEVGPKIISAGAAAMLCQHDWPGNVRELQHMMERAFILAGQEPQLRPIHFPWVESVSPIREI